MSQSSNVFEACTDIFYRPSTAFRALKDADSWSWVPFILVIAMVMIPSYFYMQTVDMEWFKNFVISQQMADKSPAEQDMVREQMSRTGMMVNQMIMVFIMVLVVNALYALYLNLMTKFDDKNMAGFTDWYGFMWWIALPQIIPQLISMFVIAQSTNGQIDPNTLNVLSFANLMGLDPKADWFGFFNSFDLTRAWSIALTVIGIKAWVNTDTKKATLIAIGPYAVIYGIWAIVKLAG